MIFFNCHTSCTMSQHTSELVWDLTHNWSQQEIPHSSLPNSNHVSDVLWQNKKIAAGKTSQINSCLIMATIEDLNGQHGPCHFKVTAALFVHTNKSFNAEEIRNITVQQHRVWEQDIHEKIRAAAAPMKPKKGAISSPLTTVDIFQPDL